MRTTGRVFIAYTPARPCLTFTLSAIGRQSAECNISWDWNTCEKLDYNCFVIYSAFVKPEIAYVTVFCSEILLLSLNFNKSNHFYLMCANHFIIQVSPPKKKFKSLSSNVSQSVFIFALTFSSAFCQSCKKEMNYWRQFYWIIYPKFKNGSCLKISLCFYLSKTATPFVFCWNAQV